MGKVDKIEQAFSIRSVLVIDDHPLYCDALVSTLSKMFDTQFVHSANSMAEGLALAVSGAAPDLVILDLKLPDIVGLDGFFAIKEALPDVPVLVISAEIDGTVIETLMRSGAAGFIPKGADQSMFKDALEQVRNGLKFLPDGFDQMPGNTAAQSRVVTDISGRIAELTPQQDRIMRLICAGKPNKQIAYELNLAEATVKAHITALLRRLGVSNRTQAAVLVNSTAGPRPAPISDVEARALLS